jgi:GGDEF domain-containing protein
MNNGYFVIVANCKIDDGIKLGEKLISSMAELRLVIDAEIKISIGITPTKSSDSKSNLLARAHKSVEAAIRYGNNRVEYMN